MSERVNQHDTASDEELFERVKRGDELAFRTLYRRYDRRLFAYCLRVVKDQLLAEDTFQSIVTSVFEKRESFTGGNFASWLFTVARHAAIKASMRKSRGESRDTGIEAAENTLEYAVAGEGPDPFLHEALHQALQGLPAEYREPLELRYFQGCSYDEISQILAISLSLTKVRIHRAKNMLQKKMSPYLQELQ